MRNTIKAMLAAILVGAAGTTAQMQQSNVHVNGETIKSDAAGSTFDPELIASLRSSHSRLSEQDAFDIADVITAIKGDPESMKLLEEMRKGATKKDLEELKQTLDDEEIIQYMVKVLDELKAVEILFSNPERAFEEMKKDGLIPTHRIELYAQSPQLLEYDTRKGLYFSMLSLAATGGYL